MNQSKFATELQLHTVQGVIESQGRCRSLIKVQLNDEELLSQSAQAQIAISTSANGMQVSPNASRGMHNVCTFTANLMRRCLNWTKNCMDTTNAHVMMMRA